MRLILKVSLHREKVRKRAAVTAGAASAVGAHGSSVNEMIAGRVLSKGRSRGVAVDGFSHIHTPLCPAIGGAVGARRLHGGGIVRVDGEAGSQPRDDHMP